MIYISSHVTLSRLSPIGQASISRWTFHNSRIHSLAWTADGAHVASGSLDTHVYVWSIAKVRGGWLHLVQI